MCGRLVSVQFTHRRLVQIEAMEEDGGANTVAAMASSGSLPFAAFSRYRMIKLLGHGSFGSIYLAVSLRSGRVRGREGDVGVQAAAGARVDLSLFRHSLHIVSSLRALCLWLCWQPQGA